MTLVRAIADHKPGTPGGFVIIVRELKDGYVLGWIYDANLGPLVDLFMPGELRELTAEEEGRLPWNDPKNPLNKPAARVKES